ncbi:MAG TPA: hypothetical protein VK540_35590 [Polyangiaceae bacterium]|nr:hypothetical protein [Polyangiaceae bacterium]
MTHKHDPGVDICMLCRRDGEGFGELADKPLSDDDLVHIRRGDVKLVAAEVDRLRAHNRKLVEAMREALDANGRGAQGYVGMRLRAAIEENDDGK